MMSVYDNEVRIPRRCVNSADVSLESDSRFDMGSTKEEDEEEDEEEEEEDEDEEDEE
jgi:hypothetical protein